MGFGISGLGRTVRSDGDNDRYLPADDRHRMYDGIGLKEAGAQ
jgi:hypothetical protein